MNNHKHFLGTWHSAISKTEYDLIYSQRGAPLIVFQGNKYGRTNRHLTKYWRCTASKISVAGWRQKCTARGTLDLDGTFYLYGFHTHPPKLLGDGQMQRKKTTKIINKKEEFFS